MPVFHPHGVAAQAVPVLASRGGVLATLKAIYDSFLEARAMQSAAFKRGLLINR